jgi:hypothetical protein
VLDDNIAGDLHELLSVPEHDRCTEPSVTSIVKTAILRTSILLGQWLWIGMRNACSHEYSHGRTRLGIRRDIVLLLLPFIVMVKNESDNFTVVVVVLVVLWLRVSKANARRNGMGEALE